MRAAVAVAALVVFVAADVVVLWGIALLPGPTDGTLVAWPRLGRPERAKGCDLFADIPKPGDRKMRRRGRNWGGVIAILCLGRSHKAVFRFSRAHRPPISIPISVPASVNPH